MTSLEKPALAALAKAQKAQAHRHHDGVERTRGDRARGASHSRRCRTGARYHVQVALARSGVVPRAADPAAHARAVRRAAGERRLLREALGAGRQDRHRRRRRRRLPLLRRLLLPLPPARELRRAERARRLRRRRRRARARRRARRARRLPTRRRHRLGVRLPLRRRAARRGSPAWRRRSRAQAFAGAAALVTERSTAYLREATAAYRVIPRSLLTSVPAGPWIRLYAFTRMTVLNAQLQSTISLAAYATGVGRHRRRALATRMQTAAATTLPRFDTGYWSDYSLAGRSVAGRLPRVRRVAPAQARGERPAVRRARRSGSPATRSSRPRSSSTTAGVGQVRFWLSKPATVTVTSAAGPTKRAVARRRLAHASPGSRRAPASIRCTSTRPTGSATSTSFDALPIVKVAGRGASRRPARPRRRPSRAADLLGRRRARRSVQGAIAQRLGLRLVRIGVAWPTGATAPDPGLVAAFGGLPAGLQRARRAERRHAADRPDRPGGARAVRRVARAAGARDRAARPRAGARPPRRWLPTPPTLEVVRDAVHAVVPAVAVGPLVDGSLAPKHTVAALGRALAATGRPSPRPTWSRSARHPQPGSGCGRRRTSRR